MHEHSHCLILMLIIFEELVFLVITCHLTFVVWSVSVVTIFHAYIIWISKLAPILCWNTEQALYNLERQRKSSICNQTHSKRAETL